MDTGNQIMQIRMMNVGTKAIQVFTTNKAKSNIEITDVNGGARTSGETKLSYYPFRL